MGFFCSCFVSIKTPQKHSVFNLFCSSPDSESTVDTDRRIYEFELHSELGHGSYGTVYAARDKLNGAVVAVKRIRYGRNGRITRSSFNEIQHLSECTAHPSVVDLKAVVYERSSVFLVMEHADTDLHALIRKHVSLSQRSISEGRTRYFMEQILGAVAFLHSKDLVHGDIKPANILVTDGEDRVKLSDFGCCHKLNQKKRKRRRLRVFGTQWYCAPELLIGATEYSKEIDMWSVGCTMAEMIIGEPIFRGATVAGTLRRIFRTLGPPTERSWPRFQKLSGHEFDVIYHDVRSSCCRRGLEKLLVGDHHVSAEGMDLLKKLLTCNPSKRITASAALKHKWFKY